MPDPTMVGAVDNALGTAEAPPIVVLLPLLNLALSGLALVIDLGIYLLLSVVYPLRAIWLVVCALLSPLTFVVDLVLDIVLFTPLSIVSTVSVALYPVYVFCAAACIFGTIIGIFGHYISTAILSTVAQSPYFIRSSTPPAFHLPVPQVALRKRKRKSVRLQ